MQEIKYQLLNNNDEHPTLNEISLKHNRLQHYLQECKRQWMLKVLFICFVFVKGIYVINSFNSHNGKDGNCSYTDIIFENDTSRCGTTSLDFLCQVSEKENDSLTATLSYNNCNTATANDTNDTITLTTAVATKNQFETLKMTFNADGTTMGNTIEDNNYDNVDLTMAKTIDSENNSKATRVINLNTHNIDKTPIQKPKTAAYIIERLMQTTEIIADLQTDGNTTAMTTSPVTSRTLVVKSSSAVGQRYFIDTAHCRIPFVEPFTPEIRKIFKPQHYTGCTKDKAIVTSSFSDLESRYTLHINYSVAEDLRKRTNKSKPIEEDLSCCYKQIVRSGTSSNADASFKLLPCTNFHQDFVVPKHISGIIVSCKSITKKSLLQEDAFSFVQVNETLTAQKSNNATVNRRKLSILMIGIDTLSRINFRRNMPETFKYLVDNKWFELMGYNKVGDNTLPNLMPLLSGYTRKTVYKKCHPKRVGGFDNCNFIWTSFKKNGYHTAYAEDSSSIATFNYHLKGFSTPPTDYYFRPMALAIEKSMKRTTKAGISYCLGRKQFGEYIYDYATEFATRFRNQSTFGFFWTNSFSHNSYDVPATMDKTMLKYFRGWERQGIFENSVVIFLSDHGARWGPLLKLSQGFLEERLPMFFISVPTWFRREFPRLVKNLEINQRRLSNPFDIHMTLQHLLKLTEHNYTIQQAFDCPKCQSIFEELPENRTCDDASIPEAWCTCSPFKKASTESKIVQTIAKLVVREMNDYYKRKNLTSICNPLQLKEITNAKWRYPDESKSSNTITTYVIDFTTEPITKPKTLFSASVDYDEGSKSIHLNVEDISRQSLYENTAKCTDDAQAKKYCICKNSLK